MQQPSKNFTRKIFIDPDDTQDVYLLVLVLAPTGIYYANQCAGYATDRRGAEGFLIPLIYPTLALKVYDWFWNNFQGYCDSPEVWTEEKIKQLKDLVEEIPCWNTDGLKNDEKQNLKLDITRMNECVEAWIPVLTPYGKGFLTLPNSD